MNKSARMSKFLNSIGITDLDIFDMDFISITKSEFDENLFIYNIKKETPWNYHQFEIFFNGLSSITSYNYKINFTYLSEIDDESIKNFVEDWYFNHYMAQPDFYMTFVDNHINLIFDEQDDLNDFQSREGDLKSLLNFIGYNYDLCLKYVPSEDSSSLLSRKYDNKNYDEENYNAEEVQEEIQQEFQEKQDVAEADLAKKLEENYKLMLEERKHRLAFKRGEYEYYHINQIDENTTCVDINGTVYQPEFVVTKKGIVICKFSLLDETDAISVTLISSRLSKACKESEDINEIKEGKRIRVLGRVDIDKFRHEIIIMGHEFQSLPKLPLRTDEYQGKKRVELHLHTKMSEMDAVTSITDYVKLAKSMGHTAIALTDHGVVQAFPDAQGAAKDNGVKILYGCELYMIEDFLRGALNPGNIDLNASTFICFDLETTGLSIKYDHITEFGAVKFVNGFVTDRLDILINPEMPIPHEIEVKTNITNEMVKNQPTIKEVLPQILEFIGDGVLVSHNIEFDYGMLNEAMETKGFGELVKPAIDTLALSKYFYAENRSHNLGSLCKRLEIDYDPEAAHRADYDAEVLSKCFSALKTRLLDEGLVTLEQLSTLPIKPELLKQRTFRPSHVTVYCKNKQGLKDLYKIISNSHVEHMGYLPFVPRSLITKYRENLIVGSACFNSDLFYSSTNRSQKKVAESMKFYDFIEIQPYTNYEYLVNIHEIPTEKLLRQYIRDIVDEAKKQGKLICATGDVHYANPEDKIYRDIYIANKAKGGVDHPLNPYRRKKLPHFENPDQYYRTTQEMLDEYKWLGDDDFCKEIVIENTNKIADMCDVIEPIPPGLYPPYIDNCENLLTELCYKTAHEQYGEVLPELVEKRLAEELHGIISNGYSVTYYIAHKLVKKANDDGYLVGSRGSVGSSFAATMAGITEVNPLQPHYRCPKCKHVEFVYDPDITSGFDLPPKVCPECGEPMIADGQLIPFQTFLGFKAEKVPDIDLNFPTDYQATAHNYTKVFLGEKNVYRAGTISTVQFKTAFGYVRNYIEEFLGEDPNKVKSAYIAALAAGCTEVKRTTGQHPGGIVVIPDNMEVYDFTPVQYPAGDTDAAWLTTHYDFHKIHDTILKLDMLGHVDPQALKMMSNLTGVDCITLPVNDRKVISLFSNDDALGLQHKYLPPDNGALGLPEFGTPFVRQMLRETNPHSFRDLLIISGLSHGTDVWNNNAQDLVNPVRDKEGNILEPAITDLHGVIGCRDDIMTYLISKGMDSSYSFKIMEKVRKGKFLTEQEEADMTAHDIPRYYIDSCNKIKYLFPKGHACAYVMMALRVGYYKVYYPLEYYATFFTLRCDQYDIESMVGGIDAIHDKLMFFKQKRDNKEKLSPKEEEQEKTLIVALEMTERGFIFRNISVEESDGSNFKVDHEHNALIPPFSVLDGLGDKAAQTIITARNEKPFISKDDLQKRGKLSANSIKLLTQLGVLDNLQDTDQLSLFDFNF